MSKVTNPISAFDRMNASVLMAVTPEYGEVKTARRRSKDHIEARPGPFAMEPDFVTIEGKRLRYARGGKADGATVLLLSPLPQSIICFEQIWPMLSDRFNLVALDLPGFGRSEGGAEVMTFEAQSRILDAFVRHMDLTDFHIVGPDVGMPVALHYVLHREHRASSLIVGAGPCVMPTSNGSIIDRAVKSGFWRQVFQIAGSGAFVEGGSRLAYVDYSPSDAEIADYVASYRGRIGPIMEWFKRYPDNLATIDPHLADLDLPVQLFWGDLDQFLLIDTAHRVHERLKHSTLTVFENCGHFPFHDKRDAFAAMIADWVETGHLAVDRRPG
ncbi:MAG TPA: alpha/beta hydrolase [Methyloceanibacter sp.]|nr:alpha/beta hydrolase [Methyloceanibacter sp.]